MFLSINNSSWQWSRTLCRNTGSLGNVVPKETAPKVFKVERAPSSVLFSRTKPRRRADGHQQMWSSLQHRAGFRSLIEAAPSCLQIIIHVTQKCNCNLIWCRENMKTDYQNFEQLVWIAALCLQVVSSHIRTFKERITASAPVAESADPQRKSSFSRPGEASRFHLSRRCLLNVPVVWAAAAPSFSFNPGNVDFWFRSSLKPGGEEKPTLAPETVCVCV